VSSKSDLASFGSLSYRFNMGPLLNTDDTFGDKNNEEQNVSEHVECKKKLKQFQEINFKIEAEYF
jgi:hypothetical protein